MSSGAKFGFWTTALTIGMGLIFPPLAPVVALCGLTGWAVFSEEGGNPKKHRVRSTSIMEAGLQDDVEGLVADLPSDQREMLIQAVTARLEQEGRNLLGDKEGQIAVIRKNGKLLAWISEDGDEGHIIEFQLP